MVTQNPVRSTRTPAGVTSTEPAGRRLRWTWKGVDDGRWRLTVAGGIATMTSSLTLSPLLDGGWWLISTALVVAAVCAAGGLARTLRAPAPTQPLISAGALLVALTVLFARSEAVLGFIPGPAAIERLQQLALQGRAFVEATVPPAGEDLGLLLLVAGGVGLTALVVDTLACALDLPGATLLPLSGLFLVPWVIGHGSAPAWTFLVVAFSWAGLLATAQGDWARRWAPSARAGRAGRVVIGMAATAAVAMAALFGGAVADSRDPLLTLGSGLDIGQGGGGTVQIDELVSLRRSLVDNDDRELMTFTTNAAQVDYLRLAVLDRFDGETWSRPPRGQLEGTPPTWAAGFGGQGDLVRYDVRVGRLAGTTVPSPSGAVTAQAPWPVAWDQRSALPSRSDGRGIRGQAVELGVWPAPWDAQSLRDASVRGGVGFGVYQSDMADPSELVGPELGVTAAQVTQGATTPYDQAVALQQWFTIIGGFRYSTDIAGGSDGNALEAFLRERVGYCEQFAATMALMARTLGIPARVVVGFTSGRQEGDKWVVRGSDAHAWPELWMGTAGWVRFEPTPGAATVRTPSYTRQLSSGLPNGVPTAAASPGATDGQDTADGRLPEAGDDAAAAGTAGSRRPWPWVAALAGVALLLSLPGLVRAVRRRRRLAGGPEQAFRELVDSARDVGVVTAGLGTVRATVEEIGRALRVPDEQTAAAVRACASADSDVAAAIARTRARTLPGMESTSDLAERQALLATALGRICARVERERYARPEQGVLVGAGAGGAGVGGAGVLGTGLPGTGPGAERPPGAVLVAEPVSTDGGSGSAGALAQDVRTLDSALRAQAPRWRRIIARVAPMSLLPTRERLRD